MSPQDTGAASPVAAAGGWVSVQVPATSANLGPGFDALGLALNLRDRMSARFVAGTDVSVTVGGEGGGDVPTDETNLVARTVRIGLATFDETGDLASRGLELHCENAIPHGRGLGSSAAAIVGGLALAALLAGREIGGDPSADSVSLTELVALGTRLEGHPDNVAPAVLGGPTVAWLEEGPQEGGGLRAQAGSIGRAAQLHVHPAITPVVMIPVEAASTQRARGTLPSAVPHADAAFNAGRTALLVHALSSAPRLLLPATEDRLHQQQRRAVYPESLALVGELRALGVPAAISGAGPSVIALAADLRGCVPVDLARQEVERLSPAGSRVEVLGIAARGVEGSPDD